MKSEINLTPRELLFIAALMDATEFIGISDAFFGMDDADIQQEVAVLQASLEKKGYAEMDFDGGFTLKKDVREMVETCANCDIFVVVDKNRTSKPQHRDLYYAKTGRIIKLGEEDGIIVLTPLSGTDSLIAGIKQGFEWFGSSCGGLHSVKISNAVLSEAKTQSSGFDSSDSVNILVKNGCDESSAKIIMDGLSGNTNYYAIIATVFEGEREGVYNAMLIDSPNGIYKMTPVSEDDEDKVQFDKLTAQQAEASMIDIIRYALPQESEGFV